MAKEIVSFALDPDEKARVDAEVARRKKAGEREMKFSVWMREAVIEKLEAEEKGAGKKTPADTEFSGRENAVSARGGKHSTDSASRFAAGVNEDAPREIPPIVPARAPGPRARSPRSAIQKVVAASKGKS